jgi:hypothetical protein
MPAWVDGGPSVAKLRECVAARISHYEHSRGRRRVVKVARFRSHRGRHRAECPRMTLHGRRVRPPLRHAASVTRTCPVYTFTASPPHPQHRSSPRRSGRSVANQRCSGNVQQQGPAAAGRSSRPPQLCPSVCPLWSTGMPDGAARRCTVAGGSHSCKIKRRGIFIFNLSAFCTGN